MRGFFVTGTDTSVGKTWVATVVIRVLARAGLKTVGMKPVASGSVPTSEGLRNDDALQLQAAANLPRPYALVNPYAFAPPIAPHLAAAEAGVVIALPRILECFRQLCAGADAVVVEGVGGWQVPLGDSWGVPELARALGLPVILVVGLRLGCLNHALLSARAIESDGLPLAGWIANEIDPGFGRRAANVATLERRMPAPLLADFPWAPAAGPATQVERLEFGKISAALGDAVKT
ncbi:MAG TPA: dethiobiotin synthase [Gammaproteobacteria bacterium]|nr:dethiobiotin synthase [Gammaproteobacteria bacterium]